MLLIHRQPFALDIPALGLVGVEPGVAFEVPDGQLAELLLGQGFERAGAAPSPSVTETKEA